MASRMTEDEKNEKIIRGLLKLPANRRCINCNNLGPQYVCTNFWTFICTNCSGIHREFCHRVKSISMAKFTSQEVSALQEGGNERAKETFFKEWDPQRHSVPDSSNIDRLRDLIKHVYVDRRYTGERNSDKPTRMKAPDDSNGSRRGDSYRGDSRSPPYDDRFRERLGTIGKNGERNVRSVYGERSPGDDQVNKRNPRHFEVVDNRQRDDRFGNGNHGGRFEDRRLPNVVTKLEGSSPSRHKDVSTSSPPILRPVRDILGDDMPHFVSDPPKSNGIRAPDNPAQAQKQAQRTSSSSSIGSSDGNSARSKIANEASLIDFSADPEPSVAVVSQSPVPQTTSASPNAGDWAAFDVASQQNGRQASANIITLESSLTQLSAPALTSTVSMPISSVDSSPMFNNGGQWPTIQRSQSSLFPVADSHTAVPQLNTLTGSSHIQTWGSQAPQNSQGSLTSSIVHSSQVAGRIPHETSAVVSSQLPLVETKPSGRKELPADLFTALYPSMPMSASGWQRAPHPNMGYGMQYPSGTAMPIFPHSPKHANPFDLGAESAPSHVPSFPSMAPMQVALSNISGSSPLVRSSSFGNPSPQGIPQKQSSFPSAFSAGPYMMQQIPSNMSQHVPNNIMTQGNRGPGGPGGEGYRNTGMDQSPSAGYYSQTQPNTPSPSNSFGSVGGNPFG